MINRRKFIQTTLSSAFIIPGSFSISNITGALAFPNNKLLFPHLCLIETNSLCDNSLNKLEQLMLNNRAISLSDNTLWNEIAKEIDHNQNQALIIIGRPATTFTFKIWLGANWKIILEGEHQPTVQGTKHHLSGRKQIINQIEPIIGNSSDPIHYLAELTHFSEYQFNLNHNKTETRLKTPLWSDNDLASVLALPRMKTA